MNRVTWIQWQQRIYTLLCRALLYISVTICAGKEAWIVCRLWAYIILKLTALQNTFPEVIIMATKTASAIGETQDTWKKEWEEEKTRQQQSAYEVWKLPHIQKFLQHLTTKKFLFHQSHGNSENYGVFWVSSGPRTIVLQQRKKTELHLRSSHCFPPLCSPLLNILPQGTEMTGNLWWCGCLEVKV